MNNIEKSVEQDIKSRKRRVGLSENEVKILQFINEFGFCEINQIMKQFGIKRTRCYFMLNVLTRIGYLVHQHIIYGRRGTYYVTPIGASYTDLPALPKISLGGYIHQIKVTDVYLKLKEKYPKASWLSERRLIQDKYADGLGKCGHLPDGILRLPDDKQIAIEIDLTPKAKTRLEKILKHYGGNFDIHEVWYFCAPHIVSTLRALIKEMSFIKVHNLTEFLYE